MHNMRFFLLTLLEKKILVDIIREKNKDKYIIYIKTLTQDCFNRVQMYGKADGTKCKDKKLVKYAINRARNNIKVTLDSRRMLANHFLQVVVLELKQWPWRHLR